MPTVSHEIGQWCVYPNFKEIDKYTGVLKAKNLEIFKETLADKGMEDMGEKFLYASGRYRLFAIKQISKLLSVHRVLPVFSYLTCTTFPDRGLHW